MICLEGFGRNLKKSGYIDLVNEYCNGIPGTVTGSNAVGISCVEKDPDNRTFYFYIAAEKKEAPHIEIENVEEYWVPACTWAIFSNHGRLPMSLVHAERYAFGTWLPNSAYKHALAPELEVYPAADRSLVEFWLPIEEKA